MPKFTLHNGIMYRMLIYLRIWFPTLSSEKMKIKEQPERNKDNNQGNPVLEKT